MRTILRNLTAAWLLVISLLFPALTRAETGVQAWVQRYNGPGHSADSANAVAVDGSNSVIVTGYSYASVGYPDYATIKYSSAGVALWTNRYDGPGNAEDYPSAVVADASNNVIVTGRSHCSGTSSGSPYDYATIKYSGAGVPLWTNRYDGPANGDDYAYAVALDNSDNVIVTGYSYGGFPRQDDYLTIKYSSDGVPLWTNRYNGTGNFYDVATGVKTDGSGSVIITGSSTGSGSGYDYTTIKYSSDGVPLWTNRYNGPGNTNDYATALAVDGNNDVIVAGYSSSTSVSPYNYDYVTIKYSSAGLPLWTNRYNGPGNGDDCAQAMALDRSGNVVVTGYSAGAGGDYDYTTIKYSSAGVPLWTNRYNEPGNGNDYAYALAVDGNNGVIVTGHSTNGASSYDYDYATIKYSSAGVPLWTNRYNGPGNGHDYAQAAAVDHSGGVIVSGWSYGNDGNSDFATVKYICVPSPVLTILRPANGTFQVRVDDLLQPGTLVIEASTNLAAWTPVFSNTNSPNVLFYTDPDAGSHLRRFYRAFQSP